MRSAGAGILIDFGDIMWLLGFCLQRVLLVTPRSDSRTGVGVGVVLRVGKEWCGLRSDGSSTEHGCSRRRAAIAIKFANSPVARGVDGYRIFVSCHVCVTSYVFALASSVMVSGRFCKQVNIFGSV